MSKLLIIPVYHQAILIDHEYYQLLFPKPKPWPNECNTEQTFFGLIALTEDIPIGGIFGIHDHLNKHFQIHSWMIKANHRNQGIGQRLLRTLETHLAKLNISQIELSYREEWPSYPLLQHILSKQGWSPQKNQAILYQLNPLTDLPSWVSSLKLRPEFEIIPWLNLTPTEQAALLPPKQNSQNPIRPEISSLATATGFGLRYRQTLIGGLIGQQPTPDLLQYSHFWVAKPWRTKGYGYYLVQAALKAQQQNEIPYTLFEIEQQHHKLISSIEKYLAPLIQHRSILKSSTKSWLYANRKPLLFKSSHNPENINLVQTRSSSG